MPLQASNERKKLIRDFNVLFARPLSVAHRALSLLAATTTRAFCSLFFWEISISIFEREERRERRDERKREREREREKRERERGRHSANPRDGSAKKKKKKVVEYFVSCVFVFSLLRRDISFSYPSYPTSLRRERERERERERVKAWRAQRT